MVNKLKTELNRVSAQLYRIVLRNGDRHWPANVFNILETKYHLRPKELLRLWYVRRRMLSKKMRQDSIFIYDRVKASDQKISIRRFSDLHKYPELLLYKGHITSNGDVKIEAISKN